ncbi:MAG: FixH family protein [Myxococcales bacterium]|nr:FixH family protein [Myxococcales bacterium]
MASLSVLLVLLTTACGSSEPEGEASFEAEPLTTVSSDSGQLRVSVWTSPDQPPARGILTLRLLAEDAASQAPVDALFFDIVPEMPSMGHGTPTVPKTKAANSGVYTVSDVNLFMPGRWELRMTITGAVSDVAIVQLDVH